jgi:hypothetical protein
MARRCYTRRLAVDNPRERPRRRPIFTNLATAARDYFSATLLPWASVIADRGSPINEGPLFGEGLVVDSPEYSAEPIPGTALYRVTYRFRLRPIADSPSPP